MGDYCYECDSLGGVHADDCREVEVVKLRAALRKAHEVLKRARLDFDNAGLYGAEARVRMCLDVLNKLGPGSAPPGACASPADPGSISPEQADAIFAALSGVREALDEIATDSVKTRQDIEGKPTTTHYSIGHSDACEHFWRKAREARDELDRLVEEVSHAATPGNAGASPDPATHSADQGSDPAVSSDAAGSGVGGYELSPIPTRDLAVMLCQLMFPKDLDFASAIRDEIIRRGNAR